MIRFYQLFSLKMHFLLLKTTVEYFIRYDFISKNTKYVLL